MDSPYLGTNHLECHILLDGVIIYEIEENPNENWFIAGGPGIMVDYEPSRIPDSIIDILKHNNLYKKPINIYRIVSKSSLDNDIWNGVKPICIETKSIENDFIRIKTSEFGISVIEMLQRLTYGALAGILNIELPNQESNFWQPFVIKNLGFLTADRRNHTFYRYLEIQGHIDKAAWDSRSLEVKVWNDISRDFKLNYSDRGVISFPSSNKDRFKPFISKVNKLEKVILDFQVLLESNADGNESIFHEYIEKNPILLDIYGEPESKPRLIYPSVEDSPIGKKYVEPDFIVKLPQNNYILVELERPNKRIATKVGTPRSEVTQTTFQVAEWKTYIANHYDLIKDRYPYINTNYRTMVVISRDSTNSFGSNIDISRYKQLLKSQFAVDEVITYDDLLHKAKGALIRLQSL